jgi:hypothetical protein
MRRAEFSRNASPSALRNKRCVALVLAMVCEDKKFGVAMVSE